MEIRTVKRKQTVEVEQTVAVYTHGDIWWLVEKDLAENGYALIGSNLDLFAEPVAEVFDIEKKKEA